MIHQNIRPVTEGVPNRTEPVAVMRDILVFYRQLEPHAFSTQPSQNWDVGSVSWGICIQNKAVNIRLTLRRVHATIVAVEKQ